MKKIIYAVIYILRFVIYLLDRLEYRKIKTDSDILESYDMSEDDIYIKSEGEPLKLKYIHLCKPEIEYRIISDTQSIGCADWHPIINENNEEIRAENLKIGDSIKTINGIEKIKKIIKLPFKRYMYDLTVEEPHTYYANNILVHNCVTFDTLIDVTDSTTNIKYRLPIFEIHYMFKKELSLMDIMIRNLYRIKLKIKLKIDGYNKV